MVANVQCGDDGAGREEGLLLRFGWELEQDVGSAHAQEAAAVLRPRGRRSGHWGRMQKKD